MLEIESGKLAQTKSDSAKTRQFADRMIKDHTKTSNGLKALVSSGKAQATVPAELDKAHKDTLEKAFASKTLPHLQEHLKMAQDLDK